MKDIVDNELTTREILEKLFDELEPENPFLRKSMKNPNRSDLYNEIVQNYENAEKKEWLAKRNPDAEKRFVMSFEDKDAKETEMLFDGKKINVSPGWYSC